MTNLLYILVLAAVWARALCANIQNVTDMKSLSDNGSFELYDANLAIAKLRSSVAKFKETPFERVVTFGNCCLPKMKVTGYYQAIGRAGKLYNHLFDWMVLYNYTLLAEAVNNNFDDVFRKETLKVRLLPASKIEKALYNEKYRFFFNHAFENVPGVSHTILTERMFQDNYHHIEEKFKHLTIKSQQAINTSVKTLYIVFISDNHVPYPENPNFNTHSDILNLLMAIKRRRDDNFLLLVLVNSSLARDKSFVFDQVIEGNLIYHQVNHFDLSPQWGHHTVTRQWNSVLDAVEQP